MRPVSDVVVVLKAYKNAFYTIDEKINKFKTNFMKVEDALVRGTAFRVELAVFRVLDKLEDIGNKLEDIGKYQLAQACFSHVDLA
jgi:hypothetical protein